MNKNERAAVIRKLKPATWYAFCQMESLYPEEAIVTRNELAQQLGICLQTLNKYLAIWESHKLIREVQRGFIIAQMDGQPSGVTEEPVEREFKNARDIINYWCHIYEEQYGRPYTVNNWAMAQAQVKKLMRYQDAEIKATLLAIVSLYDRTWAKPNYPRPTLGAVCSWLYQQAQPYAVVTTDSPDVEVEPDHENLLEEMEAKGWL